MVQGLCGGNRRIHLKRVVKTLIGCAARRRRAPTLTETQDEFVLRRRGDDLGSQEVVQQHLQAQQLDGGEGRLDQDAGVQAHPGRVGGAVEAWRGHNKTQVTQKTNTLWIRDVDD